MVFTFSGRGVMLSLSIMFSRKVILGAPKMHSPALIFKLNLDNL